MLQFKAWSDGSCDNLNPKRPGGAAYIIFDANGMEIKRASKGFLNTSNNRMELLAIMSIVNSLPVNSFVAIYSDSLYCINVLSGVWEAYENLDQINRYNLIVRNKNISVTFNWVRGHSGDKYNELCDKMARSEYDKIREEVPKPEPKKRGRKGKKGGSKDDKSK